MPSAHAQNAVAVWGEVAGWVKRPWSAGFAVGLMIVIGISRIYLGVHFPTDVLVGWGLGWVVLWLFNRLTHLVMAKLRSQRSAAQLLTVWVTSMALLLPSVLIVGLSSNWEMPAAWVQQLQASGGTQPQPLSLNIPVSAAGTWLGFGWGALWLNQRCPFQPEGQLWQRVMQYGVGLAIALLIWAGLDYLLPEGRTVIAYCLRYLRYALLGGWIAAGAPWVFRRMPH